MAQDAAQRLPAQELRSAGLLIAGAWADGVRAVDIPDKFHLTPFMTAQLPSREQVSRCVAAAGAAFAANRLGPHERGAILDRAAVCIEQRAEEIVEILVREAGFPRRDALGELQRCAITFRLSAEEARRFVGDMVPIEGAPGQKGRMGFTLRAPLGIVCAITPFNAPSILSPTRWDQRSPPAMPSFSSPLCIRR